MQMIIMLITITVLGYLNSQGLPWPVCMLMGAVVYVATEIQLGWRRRANTPPKT